MNLTSAEQIKPPNLELQNAAGQSQLLLAGNWTIAQLAQGKRWQALQDSLQQHRQLHWDLSGIERLDLASAQFLRQIIAQPMPASWTMSPSQRALFDRVEEGLTDLAAGPALMIESRSWWWPIVSLGGMLLYFLQHARKFIELFGQFVLDLLTLLSHPWRGPWKEISANLYRSGAQALGITALVGFLIGVVLSFLSAQQLKVLGANVFIVNLLAISIVRELGPMLAAILVAGRSGSSITAQIGVMRVTQELDALVVMGIAHGYRLVMPRVLALMIAMPLLVLWTDALALVGGMFAARMELGLSYAYFIQTLQDAITPYNLWLGLGKGVVFGSLIGLVACYFGMQIRANTESLGQGTTTSVVTAITLVILADAVFAIIFSGMGT
ncbi:MlaE family lipid ABC transporter permease subunit [Ampullimonas aquatilis]|uniref:ABC transporter permease n=1 Tax=Ampullimonas aquatilis TaxID=1341549 RepID=UPI003C76967C